MLFDLFQGSLSRGRSWQHAELNHAPDREATQLGVERPSDIN